MSIRAIKRADWSWHLHERSGNNWIGSIDEDVQMCNWRPESKPNELLLKMNPNIN